MLRVLTLSTLFPDASRPNFGPFVERQTLGLAAHPDVEVQVVAPIGLAPFGRFHPHYQALAAVPLVENWKGLTIHRPRFTHLPGMSGRFDGRLLARMLTPHLNALRKHFAFDVINAQFFWPDGPAAVAAARALRVPVSIKARGGDIHYWGRQRLTAGQIIYAGRAADGLLAVSSALKSDMVALGMPAKKIEVHHTGIDRTLFRVRDRAAAKARLGISGPLLISVGALITRKGHDIVIEAMKLLPNATLVVIGEGAQRPALQTMAASLGDHVRFIGSQTHARIADWLAAADAMVLMSVSEGLANAWVEALASGTPIIISNVGGAREVLDRPEAGAIVARDVPSVVDAVRSVLAREADRHAVAATVDRFSWEANTAQLYEHLKAVAARR